MIHPSDEEELMADSSEASEVPAPKRKARSVRKGKAQEELMLVPAELEQNEKLQGASPAWLKLYTSIHKQARR